MKLKDIIFLVAAIVAWLYSSYRNYQKQSAGRNLPKIPLPEEKNNPLPQRTPIIKREQVKREITVKNKPVYPSSVKQPAPISLENLTTDINIKGTALSGKGGNAEKKYVDNIHSIEQATRTSDYSASELIEDIHTAKIDWRKAFILSELLRPLQY